MAGLDLGYTHQLHPLQLHHNGTQNDNIILTGPDGATGDAGGSRDISGRRRRGRPPGSKNKQAPPVIITRESASAVRPHILEIQGGCDLIDSIAAYARRRQLGICVLTANGAVTDVSLRQASSDGSVLTLNGPSVILSLSCSFLPPPAPLGATSLMVLLAGAQGQVVGGSVVGPLLAAGLVTVVAASFRGVATYERLPLQEEEEEEVPAVQRQPAGDLEGSVGRSGWPGGKASQISPTSLGFPYFNMPLNDMGNCQPPVNKHGWAAGMAPFRCFQR